MKARRVSRIELADLFGGGIYDEQAGGRHLPRVTFHHWPPSGPQGHVTFQSCWCEPVFVGEDAETEVYRHREAH
jgi:hypothetical protein